MPNVDPIWPWVGCSAKGLALVAALVVAAAAAFGGYFWVTKHERISQPELQAKVAEDQGAKSVRCTEHTSNGSVWWCAGLVHKRSVCWLIQVSVRGKVTIGIGGNRCRKDSELAALMGRDSRIDKPSGAEGGRPVPVGETGGLRVADEERCRLVVRRGG